MTAVPFVIARVTLDTLSWTPITVPFNCTQCSIENGDPTNNIKIRTSSGDSTTERTLTPRALQIISAATGSLHTAFTVGDVICYAQAVAGTGPAIVDFVR